MKFEQCISIIQAEIDFQSNKEIVDKELVEALNTAILAIKYMELTMGNIN